MLKIGYLSIDGYKTILAALKKTYPYFLKELNVSRKNKDHLAIVVGANISAKRKHKKMNQAQLAELLGIGPDSLSRIENGITAPKFQTLENIAQILECPVAELFLYDDDEWGVECPKKCDTPEASMREIIIMAERIIKLAKTKE